MKKSVRQKRTERVKRSLESTMYPKGSDQKIDREYIRGETPARIGRESRLEQVLKKKRQKRAA